MPAASCVQAGLYWFRCPISDQPQLRVLFQISGIHERIPRHANQPCGLLVKIAIPDLHARTAGFEDFRPSVTAYNSSSISGLGKSSVFIERTERFLTNNSHYTQYKKALAFRIWPAGNQGSDDSRVHPGIAWNSCRNLGERVLGCQVTGPAKTLRQAARGMRPTQSGSAERRQQE